MKQKLWELRAKLQTKKGSILVYTLIVMMIMLSTALSIFAVAVREKKGAGLTAASLQAFAVADSGSEIALNKIANVSTLAEIGNCTDGGIVTGSIGTGMDYALTFYDSSGNQLLNCTDSVSAVDKVKSVGRYAGTARAVEVAVAQTGSCSWLAVGQDCGGFYCFPELLFSAPFNYVATFNSTPNAVCNVKNPGSWAAGWYSDVSISGGGKSWKGDSWWSTPVSCAPVGCLSYVYCCQ